MNAHAPINPAARDLANDIMGRLKPLDETIANARGFRALLEDLHGRELSAVKEPHVRARLTWSAPRYSVLPSALSWLPSIKGATTALASAR